MYEPQNGFEFLEDVKKINGNKIQSFKTFSEYLYFKARKKGIPVHGQFELTPLCNFSCKMCYVHLNKSQLIRQQILSVETWKDIIHQAFEAGLLSATLTGGECLTYPKFEELYLYLHSLGCEVAVLTNGYLLDERKIDFFRQHMPSDIQITIYGWNEDVYERVTGRRAFNKVKNNIYKAIDAGLHVSLSVTPSIYLGEDVFETIRFCKSIPVSTQINSKLFIPREETGRSKQNHDIETDFYIRIYRFINELDGIENQEVDEGMLPSAGGPLKECDQCGLQCGGGRSGFVLNWKGVLMPCNQLEMIQAYPLKDGFKAAWDIVNQEANSWPRVPECEGCAYQKVCNNCAGCMLQYAEPGNRPVELCERTKRFVQQGIKRIQKCENP